MSKRRAVILSVIAVLVAALVISGVLLVRARASRHRVFRVAPSAGPPVRTVGVPPVEQWTDVFQRLPPEQLDELLDQIEIKHRDLYAQWNLAYLHARVKLEMNEKSDAAKKLAPFLASGNPLRDLALYHQSEIDEEPAASRERQALILGYPHALYRDQAIDEETDYLASGKDPKPLADFAAKVFPAADTARRRDLMAHLVEVELRAGAVDSALGRGLGLLRGSTTDDPSDRVSRALDKPELLRRMNAEQWMMMGDSFRNHRHFDRAVAVLTMALPALPAKRDDITFSIGRSYFGDEKYAAAQQWYQRGAAATKDPKWKSTFLFHASRAAQLQGDDAAGERLLTAALAIPGRFPSTTAALTQRLRTRAKQRRYAEAAADLVLLRKIAPKDHALVEGSLAYAIAMLAAGKSGACVSALNTVPPALFDKFDGAEYAYWRGRALEASDPRASFANYLTVLRSPMPTHFAYFARERLDASAMAAKLADELKSRDAQVAVLVAAKNFVAAKQAATDRILLSSKDRGPALQRLAAIYRELPAYRDVMMLTPEPFPRFPNTCQGATPCLLMAMGLFDEAADDVPHRWPLRPNRSALTQSLALNRGQASKQSIYAIEVLINNVPDDFVPDLLPITIRQLLYPRYFETFIAEDSRKFGADPTLVLAIMREESRFNPRAKSEAAARGLLQFIITTARTIGRDVGIVDVDPEDLYDPRVIINLGAKYVAELMAQFAGNRYATAAAYNAGPKQVHLWSRLAPAPGDDYFLSSINFDETKHYVRKVMNSYRRYREIYGGAGPQGGIREEP